MENINEFKEESKDPRSPESQELLRELHSRSAERQLKMKKMIDDWQKEDRKSAST